MGLDDYAAGGGALRLKGAKVSKKKNKKKDKPSKPADLEKNLSTGTSKHDSDSPRAEKHDDGPPDEDADEREREPMYEKTESERRHEEARRKRLLQITQAGGSRPELLKTHKERVEKLNTYLSKLSEHHDMPKIGPG